MQQKAYKTIPLDKRLQMERWLKDYLKEIATDLRVAIHSDRENWFAEYHFGWGMNVRNAMRKAGYTEKWLGVENLDDVYVEAIEHAVIVSSDGEIMVSATGNAVEPFWTPMKKFITIVILLIAAHIIVKLLLKIVEGG